MTIEQFHSRLRPAGLLYVDVYPYFLPTGGGLEFLLLKRRADVAMPGVWQPVSGKIKEGEKFSEAFLRQAVEKTGQRPIRVFSLDSVNAYFDAHYDTVMLVPNAACRLTNKDVEVNSDLHLDYKWVDMAAFEVMVEFPKQIETAKTIAEVVLGKGGRSRHNEIPVK